MGEVDTATRALRRGLLWLGGFTLAGISVELAVERHWTQPIMLLAWVAVVVAAGALILLARNPSAQQVRIARHLSTFVIAMAVVGIWRHVDGNFDAGSLDQEYAATWDTLSLAHRWWLAISKTVGPSPPLAPGALAQAAFCALLATMRHPALSVGSRDRITTS